MTRSRVPVFSGDEVFPDDYGKGFQGCYEAMRAVCQHVHRLSAENMRCDYTEYTRRKGSVCHDHPRCAPHFTKCPLLFKPVFEDGPSPEHLR